MTMKHTMLRCLTALTLGVLLVTPAAAQEMTWNDVYCFSQTDLMEEDQTLLGVLVTEVPEETLGQLRLGSRQILPGDVLTGSQLESMTFVPTGDTTGDAVISCLRITQEGSQTVQMTLKIGSDKNEPPTAEDSQFSTYKNIPGPVPLTVSDPENDVLTVTIVDGPKRGEVDIQEDGTLIYTPAENKVGKDSFTYTVTDTAGNVSNTATVRITIEKPSDKQTYGDMQDDPDLLCATWLRETGIYSGKTVAGQLLFGPEETVTRGEFIAMCAGMTGLVETDQTVSSGFADEADTPAWLGPYVTQALRCGYLTGVSTDQGLSLDPDSDITQTAALEMVSSMVSQTDSEALCSDFAQLTDEPLTYRQAAKLLYAAQQYAQSETSSLLAWAAK
jgi:hypothetical protein